MKPIMTARTRHASMIEFPSSGEASSRPGSELIIDPFDKDYVIDPESRESIYAPSDYSIESTAALVHPGSRVSITGGIPSPRNTLWSGSSQISRPSAAALARRQSSPSTTSPKASRFTNPFSKVLKSQSVRLAEAAAKGDTRLVQLLIQEGLDVNSKDWTGKTALHRAASAGYLDIVRILLWEGADIEAKGSYSQSSLGNHMYGQTLYGNTIHEVNPLHRAAKGGHADVCRLLIEAGANVDAQTSYGQTPLHFAAEGGMEDAAAVLVREGKADLELVNTKGRTAVRVAAHGNHEGVMRVIVEERVERRHREEQKAPVGGGDSPAAQKVARQVLEVPDDLRKTPNSPEFLRQWIVENQGGKVVEVKIPASSDSSGSSEYWREWNIVNA